MGIASVVAGLFKPVSELISEFIPDKDLRAQLNAGLATAQIELQSEFVELEKTIVEVKGDIIVAEAKSESWVTRNWRPVTMLTFVALVSARWLGLTVEVPESVEVELMNLIKIGLGGYVVGRSAEKILPKVAAILKK